MVKHLPKIKLDIYVPHGRVEDVALIKSLNNLYQCATPPYILSPSLLTDGIA